jgi:hypothetical protein
MADISKLIERIEKLERHKCCCGSKSKTFTTDGSLKISGGSVVDLIVVKSASILPAFTVGTTDGGTDVLTAMATTTDYDPFVVFDYSASDHNLYFGGITSATTITVYTR